MIQQVFRPSRMKDGKRVVARMYRGRYRLDPRERVKDVALHTNDKQVAEQRLRKIVQNEQRECDGLRAPQHQREVAASGLQTHIRDYVADRRAIGRDEKYVRELNRKLRKLADECSWQRITEVTPESFCIWRARQRRCPKTLNEYLNAISGLMNWLEPRVGMNPLRFVQRVQIAVEPSRTRRAIGVEQLRRLIAVSGERGVIYAVAVCTGLRRGELKKLTWRDVVLEPP
jgi:integrase